MWNSDDLFEEIASIRDPEKPAFSLADLNVVEKCRCDLRYISIGDDVQKARLQDVIMSPSGVALRKKPKVAGVVEVALKPTVPHCHLMSLICLAVRLRLEESLPTDVCWKIRVSVLEGTHQEWQELTRRSNDKERVAAAKENAAMIREIKKMLNEEQ